MARIRAEGHASAAAAAEAQSVAIRGNAPPKSAQAGKAEPLARKRNPAVGTGRGRMTAASRFAAEAKAARAEAKAARVALGRKKPTPTPGPCGADELRAREVATEQRKADAATCATRPKRERTACRRRAADKAKARRAEARGRCMAARSSVRDALRAKLDDIARRRAERAAEQAELRALRRPASEKQRAASRRAAARRSEQAEEALWKDVPDAVWTDRILRAEWEREGPRFVRAARGLKDASGRQRTSAWELALDSRPYMYAAAYPPEEWEGLNAIGGPSEYWERANQDFAAQQAELDAAEAAYWAEKEAEAQAKAEGSPADDSWIDDPFAEFFQEPAA